MAFFLFGRSPSFHSGSASGPTIVGIRSTAMSRMVAPSSSGPVRRARKACCSGPAGAPKFVYLLRWPDEATLDARWAGFMADEEWSRIKDETGAREGRLVGEIENLVLRPVDYSPAL